MLTEEQQQQLIELCKTSQRVLEKTTADLATASQTISDQADTIKKLSQDNLILIAKLDAATGRKASTFAA